MVEQGLRGFEYAQVDVFAERALEGNALAIFVDGRGLMDDEMQAIARETNLSETVFLVPREAALNGNGGYELGFSRRRKSCSLPDIRRWARRAGSTGIIPFYEERRRSYWSWERARPRYGSERRRRVLQAYMG